MVELRQGCVAESQQDQGGMGASDLFTSSTNDLT